MSYFFTMRGVCGLAGDFLGVEAVPGGLPPFLVAMSSNVVCFKPWQQKMWH